MAFGFKRSRKQLDDDEQAVPAGPAEILDLSSVVPVVRSFSSIESGLGKIASLAGHVSVQSQIPYRRLTTDFVVVLVWDDVDSSTVLNQGHLDGWGVNFDELLEKTKSNIGKRVSEQSWQDLTNGVYVWEDLDGLAGSQLVSGVDEVDGCARPRVFACPNRNVLLMASLSDRRGLLNLIDQSRELASGPGFVSLRFVEEQPNGSFVALNREHFDEETLQVLHECDLVGANIDYATQTEALINAHLGSDAPYIATAKLTRGGNDDRLLSYCSWTQGVRTYLPKTEYVSLVTLDEATGKATPKIVGWATLVEHCGALMELLPTHPQRWLVADFPTAVQLAEIPQTNF